MNAAVSHGAGEVLEQAPTTEQEGEEAFKITRFPRLRVYLSNEVYPSIRQKGN